MKHNYEIRIKGLEVDIFAKVMTEEMSRSILEHFVKGARLNDISFKVKRVTPEPFSEINTLANFQLTASTSNDISDVGSITLGGTS